MNSPRTLTPFLVSLLLVAGAIVSAGAVRAQQAQGIEAAADSRAALLTNVAGQLAAHFRVEGDLQLESLRPLPLGASADQVVVDVLEFPSALASSMIVRVRLGVGAEAAEQTLVVRAQLLREVWVTRAPTERDAGFETSELETRRVDVLRERDAIPTAELCRDYRFSRPVPANRILTWRDVARRPLVRKGQLIEVAAVDGPLSITMKALAMENGAAGETVKVRNLDSKKEFNALVVADSRAQVRF